MSEKVDGMMHGLSVTYSEKVDSMTAELDRRNAAAIERHNDRLAQLEGVFRVPRLLFLRMRWISS